MRCCSKQALARWVNLIYGACITAPIREIELNHSRTLSDTDRIEVDMLRFSGAASKGSTNRLMSLHLGGVKFTNAVMFRAAGRAAAAVEVLHKKAILVRTGSFRPVTTST